MHGIRRQTPSHGGSGYTLLREAGEIRERAKRAQGEGDYKGVGTLTVPSLSD